MAQKQQTTSDGCLWIFMTMVLTVVCFGFIKVITGITNIVALLIAVVVAILLISKLLGRPSLKALLRNGIVIFLIFFGLQIMGGIMLNLLKSFELENDTFSTEEIVTNDIILEQNDTIPVFKSSRIWKDNYGNNYTGDLTVRERDYTKLNNYINNFIPTSGGNFWGNLYHFIDKKDTPSLDLVIDTFTKINNEKKLNQMEFAEMVVSCIQDIPYSFVFQDACLPPEYYDDDIKTILERCPECCIGNVAYGIQNPVSFIQNLKGDCDTRTVLIYSILKYFNYDVAILNSDFYRHSIIGIQLPTTGLHKIYNGKKYAVWETTAKYFRVGDLPATFNDITHWNVVLTSK